MLLKIHILSRVMPRLFYQNLALSNPWPPVRLFKAAFRRHRSTRLFARQSNCDETRLVHAQEQRRKLITDSMPSVLAPPLVFLGLLITLWTYKCMMTVIFQDKMIYMPYMPPFARSEKIESYTPTMGTTWSEKQIHSPDGTKIWLCIGEGKKKETSCLIASRRTVICYFQGNGSSLPPRIPFLSSTLRTITSHTDDENAQSFVIVALSYRGYWKSSGRATESGIRKDAQAMLDWVSTNHPDSDIILWGQSIGAGVACTAAADMSARTKALSIQGIILETPFTNIKSMLIALYPQKWLPYQYMWPFLWNHWDMQAALRTIAEHEKPPVLLLTAKRDEVVPVDETSRVDALLEDLHFQKTRYDVYGALHTDASTRREGQEAIARFVTVICQRHMPP